MDIRNFCIIAHIDHGKSTLADRFLEYTKTIDARKMRPQFLDTMELERERGITIKMQPVRMKHVFNGAPYMLNLIDTPGHIDFSYEVSRALAAVEGAILLVDATQGVQAQTVSVMDLARAQNLVIIPVVNKIDSPHARVAETIAELGSLFGFDPQTVYSISAKTGDGVDKLLQAVVEKIPSPAKVYDVLQALIFDSQLKQHKGIMFHARLISGKIKRGDDVVFVNHSIDTKVLEVGTFSPEPQPTEVLSAGEIGYVLTSHKETIPVGETIASVLDVKQKKVSALPGYRPPSPVVFANVFTFADEDFEDLRRSLGYLALNDPAFEFEEVSLSFARGFRCGFAGNLHMEVVLERLRREYNLDVVVSAPTASFKIVLSDGKERVIHDPSDFPDKGVAEVHEPWSALDIFVPEAFVGQVIQIAQEYEGVVVGTRNLSTKFIDRQRLQMTIEMPTRMFIQGFFDVLKSATQGHGSLSWRIIDFRPARVGRLDVLVAGKRVDAFSRVVAVEKAAEYGRSLVDFLHSIFPRELFEIRIQAIFDNRIIASRSIAALKKNVTGHLYGGDRTRKMKLWKKQKEGKKKLRASADITIAPEVFRKALSFRG